MYCVRLAGTATIHISHDAVRRARAWLACVTSRIATARRHAGRGARGWDGGRGAHARAYTVKVTLASSSAIEFRR